MPYVGKAPSVQNIIKLDSITASATASYTMQRDGANYSPQNINSVLVSLNGIIQSPGSSFTISGSTITFASTLSSSDSIDFILVYGDVLDTGVPSDSSVTNAKLNTAPTIISKGGGGSSGGIKLNCEQNSHGVTIKGPPHSASQSYTLTLPSTAPSADKALITDGSGNLSFGSAGGLVKLNTTDITSSTATLTFNNTLITSTYDKYILEYTGLKPVTDGVTWRGRFSTDNGSSFITGSYVYGYNSTFLGTASQSGSGSSKTDYILSDYVHGNDANYPSNGTFRFEGFQDANTYLTVRHDSIIENSSNNGYYRLEGWQIDNASVVNYMEFSFSSGNIADGTFTLYGLAK